MPQNKTNHQTKPEHKHTCYSAKPFTTNKAERPQKVLVSSTPKTTHMKCVRYLSSPENKNLPPPSTKQHHAMTKTCHQPGANQHPHSDKTKNSILLRKEVIQPHLPVRLPCYDFVPIANPTFDHSPHQTVVRPWASGVTNFHDVTGGVYKARERIHRSIADLRLLATPTSWGRVADPNPN